MLSLSEMRSGDTGVVAGYTDSSSQYRAKLLSMGLTPGVAFKIVRYAPMGDPIELEVRGYRLSLRRQEAQILEVRKESE